MISFSNFFTAAFIITAGITIVKGIRYWFEINWKKLLVGWGGGGTGKSETQIATNIHSLEYVVGHLIGPQYKCRIKVLKKS